MMTIITWVLGIATILGGIAAIGYLVDRWRNRKLFAEEEKVVNSTWWESSELKKKYEANGYSEYGWSNSDRVAQRVSEGKEIVYEVDETNRVKYKLVNKSGQVLLCRKNA